VYACRVDLPTYNGTRMRAIIGDRRVEIVYTRAIYQASQIFPKASRKMYTPLSRYTIETTGSLLKKLTGSTPPRYTFTMSYIIINTHWVLHKIIIHCVTPCMHFHVYTPRYSYICNELGRFPERWTLGILVLPTRR